MSDIPNVGTMHDGELAGELHMSALRRDLASVRAVSLAKDAEIERLRAIHAELPQRVIREVAELPDRTSPPDAPDMMLVTASELEAIIVAALANAKAE